jgi:hypothetical protein
MRQRFALQTIASPQEKPILPPPPKLILFWTRVKIDKSRIFRQYPGGQKTAPDGIASSAAEINAQSRDLEGALSARCLFLRTVPSAQLRVNPFLRQTRMLTNGLQYPGTNQ